MQDFAGKTSVAIGLAKHLQRDGFVVGYMKPLATRVQQAWKRGAEQPIALEAVTQDAEFVRQALQLNEDLADIVPVALTPPLIRDAIQNLEAVDAVNKIDAAYKRVSRDKDVDRLQWLRGIFHFFLGNNRSSKSQLYGRREKSTVG